MLPVINGVLSVLSILALSYVVLHPRINEGLTIKFGLILMIFGLIASAMADAPNSGFLLRIGICVVGAGYFFTYRQRRKEGLPTDFGPLPEK